MKSMTDVGPAAGGSAVVSGQQA